MATEQRVGKSVSRTELNRVELATFREVLVSVAPLIDALLVDGAPYTKMIKTLLPTPQEIG